MHGHALDAFVFLVFCGLLRPLEGRIRALVRRPPPAHAGVEPPRDASPDPSTALPTSLNSIELALIAEYNLEMARANEAVADDATKRLETRRRASKVATAWRRRAQLFQLQAWRQSAQPILPGEQSIRAPGRVYTGPERRWRMRRTQTRRTGSASVCAGHGPGDRRAGAERRRRDRRHPELAPR
jgi:hypothetical protein